MAAVNELKIIIFVLNYLTVLVYTKTIIHLSVGALASGGIYLAAYAASVNTTTSHLHFGE